MNQQGHSQQHLLQLCHFRLRARFAAVDCIGPDEGCREWMDQNTYNILLHYICVQLCPYIILYWIMTILIFGISMYIYIYTIRITL